MNYKEELLKIAPRWRTRRAATIPGLLEELDKLYPGVPLNLQIYAIITNWSPYCAVCKSPVKTLGKETCSNKCKGIVAANNSKSRITKQKKTLIEKYGVDNIRNIPGANEKRMNTMLEKYGSSVSDKTRILAKQRAPELNAKGRKTLKEKYNVSNAGQIPGHYAKCKDTMINNYGVDHYTKTEEYKEQVKVKQQEKFNCYSPDTITILNINRPLSDIYNNPNLSVEFRCSVCNNTETLPSETFKWRLQHTGTPCVNCSNITRGSLSEQDLANELEVHNINIERNVKLLGKKEIDIFLPDFNIGIEFDGLFWHNDLRISKNYHLQKTQDAAEKGIRLIHVFEDEWLTQRNLVVSRILNLCNYNTHRIGARQCSIVHIDQKTEKNFLLHNHIQSYAKSSVKLGLLYNNQLVSVMTFSKPNLSKGAKKTGNKHWELLRFANLAGWTVYGSASRLFKHFIKEYSPEQIVTFADLRWNTGDVYSTMGFKFVKHTGVNYWYFKTKDMVRLHRFGLRKNKDDDQDLTEYENRLQQGFLRIWDCGSNKYIWQPQKNPN